jgi:arylsulfatase A-like enzyme
MLPVFNGNQREMPEQIVSGYRERFRMYRKGDWKIVNTNGESWALYNLGEDLTETNNLATSNPEKLEELIESYKSWEASLPGGKALF